MQLLPCRSAILEPCVLAGFLEGEAHLRIHEQNGGQSLGMLR